jgi:meckelin
VTLIWFVFLWVGLGWQHWVMAEPGLSVQPNEMKVANIFLEFFWAGLLFFGIGAVQVALHRIEAWSGDGSKVASFVDLCTLANVSLLLFDEYAHGFYVHAKAPWGASDVPLDCLQEELREEINGN